MGSFLSYCNSQMVENEEREANLRLQTNSFALELILMQRFNMFTSMYNLGQKSLNRISSWFIYH